ncbi:CSD-domain-containing protein [Rhizoclosmatium globosum]|uniref:CSD-domain-containing protein n=1 Tax=Rhizoclosmatium globosum TaxID=329046 RepID=A0A1Y2D1D6_9FUNG|nr:CSD-domain-containing protein [Rhizoclosmatium globosum]|eukprot:ORY53099.1 CSD-domain-containing protein [Rhizoclosmatium globosum]
MSSAATTTTSDQPSLALDQRASVAESPAGGLSSGVLLRPSESHRSAGYVKFFNAQKGYGFIIPHEGEADAEVFVHHTAIIKPDGGFRSLLEGEDVEFDLIHGPKGLQAANVTGPGGTSVIGDPQAGFQQQPQPMHSMFSPMMGVYMQSPYLPPGQFPNGAPPSESYNDKAPLSHDQMRGMECTMDLMGNNGRDEARNHRQDLTPIHHIMDSILSSVPPAEGTVLPEDASPQQAIPPEYMNQPPPPQQQLQPCMHSQPLPPQPVKTLKKGRVPQQHQSNGNTNQTESR